MFFCRPTLGDATARLSKALQGFHAFTIQNNLMDSLPL
jgi:hypothetical protein